MIGDLLVTLYIGNSVKDLEQEVDIPTGETLLWWKLCVPWEHHCVLCSTESVLWGQCWVKMELCRSHIPSVVPGNGRNCACTGENSCEMKK